MITAHEPVIAGSLLLGLRPPAQRPRERHAPDAMSDHIELSFPARPEFLSMARHLMGVAAARVDFTLDETEDLRLAVEELCLGLLDESLGPNVAVSVGVDLDTDGLTVRVRLVGSNGSPRQTPGGSGLPPSLSERLLDALVDEHGESREDDEPVAWLRKSREHRNSGP